MDIHLSSNDSLNQNMVIVQNYVELSTCKYVDKIMFKNIMYSMYNRRKFRSETSDNMDS